MANPHNVELETAKFLHKLIQESKDEPTKLATKLYVILQYMRSIGKENSMPYEVISRAMETVIKQHGLDIEAMSSRLPLAAGAQVGEPGSSQVAGSSQRSGVTKDPKASLAGMGMSKPDSCASGMSLVGPGNGGHDIYQGSPCNMMVSKALHGEGEQSAMISTRTYVMAQNNVTAEQNAGAAPPSRIMQPSSSYPKAVMVVDGINKENNFRVEQDDANCSRKKGIVRTLDEEYHISRDVLEKYSAKKLEEVVDILGVSRSTLKRICRKHNIFRWPPCKAKKRKFTAAHQEFLQSTEGNIEDSRLKKQSFSYLPQKQDLATKANKAPDAIVHDVSSIIVKATYRDDIVKFHLSLSSRKTDLEEEVSKRLNLSVGSFKIKYLDEDNDWVLVTCDADLRSCITILRSLGNTTIRMLVSQLSNDNSNLCSNLSLVI